MALYAALPSGVARHSDAATLPYRWATGAIESPEAPDRKTATETALLFQYCPQYRECGTAILIPGRKLGLCYKGIDIGRKGPVKIVF